MLMDWSDDNLIGIDEIDAQHKEFFRVAHRLYDSILNAEGEEVIDEAIKFLQDYARNHFRTEEAFMKKHGYGGLEDHKKLHEQFFEKYDELTEELASAGPTQDLADKALDIVQDWLIDHIAGQDSQYAKHVLSKADKP